MSEPWLGHRDLCPIQWSDYCDCDPSNPVDLSELDAEAEFFELQEENYRAGES